MDSNAKATIIAAAIGGIFVCLAAVIGLFSPLTGKLVERVLGSDATPLPTIVAQANPTTAPANTITPGFNLAATPTAPAGPPLTFIVINDLPLAQGIFINGVPSGYVETGGYVTFSYPHGNYLLQNCPNGMTPQGQLNSCTSATEDVQTDPYVWWMQGKVTPTSDVTFIVRNISQFSYDLFVDDQFDTSVDPGKYVIQHLARGEHTVQPCLRGTTPQSAPGSCMPAQTVSLDVAVFPFDISD